MFSKKNLRKYFFLFPNWMIVQPVLTHTIYSTSTNSIFTSKPLASQTCFELKWHFPPVHSVLTSNFQIHSMEKHFPATLLSFTLRRCKEKKIAPSKSAHWYVVSVVYLMCFMLFIRCDKGTGSLKCSLTMVRLIYD